MSTSFGRRLLDVTPREALDLEREAGLSEPFAPLDRLLTDAVRASLAGDRVAELTKTRARGHQLDVPVLSATDREWAWQARSVEAIQSNGFWGVPEKASVRVGPLSTAWSLRQRGRFGPLVSVDERARLALDTPEAILTWSALAPVADLIYRPVYLRTVEAGEADRETQIAEWASVADTLDALGVPDLSAFEAIQYGGGWTKLGAEERHRALLDYCDALRDAIPDDVGSRLRLRLARPLIEKYYARALKDGTALQKRVVIAALRPVFVGVWGGDWTGFVAYLGERVHAQEHVATALPSLDLAEPPTADLGAVAEATGTTPDDVAAVAAAVLGVDTLDGTHGQDHIGVLREFWDVFDAEHARQTSQTGSLWGLVDSGALGPPPDDSGVHPRDLYRSHVPALLAAQIEALWGGHVWTRNPQRTVTEWTPHARMAEAFGPALAFWEGVALTAWFVCKGPSSRTDFAGLAAYHAREIAELADGGTPVDREFLRALSKADRLLGPPQQVWTDERTTADESGLFSVTVRSGGGTRRDGFEKVRDLITRARREWADRHLDAYLEGRRTQALERAAERYHVAVNARGGKPPTLKQTAKDAASATNVWLGGDLNAFYRLIREKSPAQVEDGRLVTRSPDVALAELHAHFVSLAPHDESSPGWVARRLLKPATDYVRWLEATGEAPGPDRIKDVVGPESPLGPDPQRAWTTFVDAVERSCLSAPTPCERDVQERLPETTRAGSSPEPPDVPGPVPPSATPSKPWWKRLLGG